MADGQVPAGWYPDPAGDLSKIRYWDGQAWTEHTQAAVNPEPQSPAAGTVAPVVGTAPLQAGAPPVLQPIYAPGQNTPVYAAAPQGKDRSGMAVASLVLGILSVPCACAFVGFLFGVPAIIFGILGIKSSKRGFAVAGVICGVAGLLLTIFMIALFAMSWSDIVANPTDYGLSEDYFEIYTF